jgi:hypothetical protein
MLLIECGTENQLQYNLHAEDFLADDDAQQHMTFQLRSTPCFHLDPGLDVADAERLAGGEGHCCGAL